MTKFCGACGSPLPDTAIYCGGCGAATARPASRAQEPAPAPQAASDPANWATVALPVTAAPPPPNAAPASPPQGPPAYQTPPAYQNPPAYVPAPAAYAPAVAYPGKKSNTLLKVVIAVVVLLCVGSVLALAGLYYGVRMVKEKVHQVAARELGDNNVFSGNDSGGGGFKGDPCRFLSNAEVSQAVGLTVIRADAKDESCSYIAKGDPADVTAKHAAAMLGGLGADAKAQKAIQGFAGAIFAQAQASDKSLAAEAATGEIPVLVVNFTSGNAQMEMKLNRAAFARIGSADPPANQKAGTPITGSGDLTGVGDEAYVVGGSMIMVRKANTVAHFAYISCPCNTDNIKPLAQMVASRL